MNTIWLIKKRNFVCAFDLEKFVHLICLNIFVYDGDWIINFHRDSQTNRVMLENDKQKLQTPLTGRGVLVVAGSNKEKRGPKRNTTNYPFKWRSLHTVFREPSFQRQTNHFNWTCGKRFNAYVLSFSFLSFSRYSPSATNWNQMKHMKKHLPAITHLIQFRVIRVNFFFSYFRMESHWITQSVNVIRIDVFLISASVRSVHGSVFKR